MHPPQIRHPRLGRKPPREWLYCLHCQQRRHHHEEGKVEGEASSSTDLHLLQISTSEANGDSVHAQRQPLDPLLSCHCRHCHHIVVATVRGSSCFSWFIFLLVHRPSSVVGRRRRQSSPPSQSALLSIVRCHPSPGVGPPVIVLARSRHSSLPSSWSWSLDAPLHVCRFSREKNGKCTEQTR